MFGRGTDLLFSLILQHASENRVAALEYIKLFGTIYVSSFSEIVLPIGFGKNVVEI